MKISKIFLFCFFLNAIKTHDSFSESDGGYVGKVSIDSEKKEKKESEKKCSEQKTSSSLEANKANVSDERDMSHENEFLQFDVGRRDEKKEKDDYVNGIIQENTTLKSINNEKIQKIIYLESQVEGKFDYALMMALKSSILFIVLWSIWHFIIYDYLVEREYQKEKAERIKLRTLQREEEAKQREKEMEEYKRQMKALREEAEKILV